MSLDRRLKCEAPIKGRYDGMMLALVMRASLGCVGLTTVVALLRSYWPALI